MKGFTEIINGAKAAVSRTGFVIKTHSPEILAVAGVVGVVAGTVLACKATTKANDILDEHHKALEQIEEVKQNPDLCKEKDYDPETDGNNDTLLVYVQTGAKFIKLYAPAAVCIALGIACMLGSNYILRNRWLGAAGAYEALNASVKEYRRRVGEDVGEEKEKELWNNVKAIDITEKNENGMDEVKKVRVADPGRLGSPYAVIFDEFNSCWKRDSSYNRIFLQCQEAEANRLLDSRGYLFLYEVLELLGYYYEPENDRCDISPELAEKSRYIGWTMKDKKAPNVEFSILHAMTDRAVDFRRGNETSAVIDFNVDGDIRAALYGRKRIA